MIKDALLTFCQEGQKNFFNNWRYSGPIRHYPLTGTSSNCNGRTDVPYTENYHRESVVARAVRRTLIVCVMVNDDDAVWSSRVGERVICGVGRAR